jgi:hypothetical protein
MNTIIYERLIEVARERRYTNYTDVGLLVGLEPFNPILWNMLDEINIHERRENRPMLSALVINQIENKPGPGFFKCARGLGVFQGGDEFLFWINQLNEVWNHWSSR